MISGSRTWSGGMGAGRGFQDAVVFRDDGRAVVAERIDASSP